MPVLPEVESLKQKLKAVLPGKVFASADSYHPKSFHGELYELINLEVKDVTRRAKVLRFHLNADQSLITHLKMTGQLIYLDENQRLGGGHPTADWVQQLPSSHTRIHYWFDDGSQLFFNDQRLFGWMKLLPDSEVESYFSTMAPDIDQPEVTVEYLSPLFQRRSQAIKQVIMDPKVVSGVGNIYACDALNVAQISPFRPAKSLSPEETGRLLAAMKQVIAEGIELGGTTFDGKYVDISGFAGGYQNKLRVYGREGEICPQCGGEIIKQKLGGRGTYFCSVCQA